MVLSWRSVGAGLLAGCLAFLVAYFINPVHLGILGVILLIFSGVIGFLASATLGKKFSRQDSDPHTAIMAFAFIFFVGIYAPITAIWANAPFYSWSITVKGKPKSEILAPVLATAIEKTATGTYLGLFVLLGIVYGLLKYVERKKQSSRHPQTNPDPRLGWVDIAFAVFALLQSFICAFLIFNSAIDSVNVFALVVVAFLQCFLFRSLRLQCQSLWKQPPKIGVQPLTKMVGIILLMCTVLCSIIGVYLFAISLSGESGILVWKAGLLTAGTVILLLPIFVCHLFVGSLPETDDDQIISANYFAIRCGSCSFLGMFLIIGGLVFRGLAQKEFNSTSLPFVTPFADSVIALEPLCPGGAFLFLFAMLGGFFVALVLPHDSILAHQRILATAQGGAIGGVVFFSLLIVFCLNLAVCTIPCIPVSAPPQLIDIHSARLLLADGKWPMMGYSYVLVSICLIVLVASAWAIEAMLACVMIWIKEQF